MQVYNVPNIIPSGTVMDEDINGQAMQLLNIFGFSIQVVWTGTPTGTFKLQGSSDPIYKGQPGKQSVPTNWSDIAQSSQAVSAAGNYMWNAPDCMYNFVRVVYVDGSGGTSTAVITSCTFNAKGI